MLTTRQSSTECLGLNPDSHSQIPGWHLTRNFPSLESLACVINQWPVWWNISSVIKLLDLLFKKNKISLSKQDKFLIESLLLLSWEYGNVPTWLNPMCQCCHVSVWRQKILFTLHFWSYPRGGHHCRHCPEVKTDTVYFPELCKPFVCGPKS